MAVTEKITSLPITAVWTAGCAEIDGGTLTVSVAALLVTLSATLTDGEGEIIWFERRSNGELVEKGKGESFVANVRVKADTRDLVYYVCVKRPDGQSGGRLPVRIPVLPPE